MSGCRVARLSMFFCLLVGMSSSLFAQGARMNPSGAKEESDRDRPEERDKWFMQGRVTPDGKSPAQMRWLAYQQKIQLRAARIVAARQAAAANQSTSAAASTGWTALGPAPLTSDPGTGQDYGFVSGRATSVLIDPADLTGNTVYLGGAYGGLWRTTNGAASNASAVTWTPLIDNQPTLAVGAIAVQPGNAVGGLSNVVLVGTGEANSSGDSYYGLGILRSTNQGQTWTLITQDSGNRPFHGMAFSKMAFSTGNANLVVAATATSSLGVLDGARTVDNRGLYVSSNAGQTWTYETSVKDGATSISPLSNSVTSVVYNDAANKFYAVFRYHGFYSSTDGANWTRLVNQPAAAGSGLNRSSACPSTLGSSPTCPIYRGEIAVVPGRNEMYVWYVDPGEGDQGVWQSTDGGTTWNPINDNGVANCGDAFGGCGTVQGGYDLEIAAVANPVSAGATDLYVGTRNVYKCTITTASPTCAGNVPNTMMNLTHVYGCVGIGHATVHPDQHSLALTISGGHAIMYLAHDGGLNRSLDAYALTNSGACDTPFDDLNGTLGSMTEFVSFSQDPANPTTLLGGTQDNGSPATSQTNSAWHSVLGGDGGYNQIDPAIPNNWYTANTDVSVQLCTKGSACLEGNGDFTPIVTNSNVGNDAGSFYTPYILDPQNTPTQSAILVGTCRIWRGTTAAGFTAISPDFFLPGGTPCSGSSAPIHAFAAGGAKDAGGFSKVIYAGLEGTGSGPGVNPQGGGVYVTTNSGTSWNTVTPTQNPHYTIGDIAIDSSDATGNTAYVGLQGFGTTHVLKTTNAGAAWTDFSGTLPNAPVNSLVVDAVAHVVYVGMDVGVFSSPAASATWTEVGPAPGSGTAGYIPDAPVTRLRMFNSGGNKILRASTYGRGIWQFVFTSVIPDFTVSIPTTTLTTYPSHSASFAGTLTSVNGYSSPVNLSCTGATKPTPCAPAVGGSPVTPTPTGAAFSMIAASSTTGDFAAFAIRAAGTDSVPQLHDTSATLHVVDFSLGTPSPANVTVNVPNSSAPITIPITESSNFADTLVFSCPNAPANISCTFTGTTATATTLTITTAAGAVPVTNFALTISANAVTNPLPVGSLRNTSLSLTVTAVADYTLTVGGQTPPSVTVQGQPTYAGTITFVNGYNSTPTISCTAGTTAPPATCNVTANPKTATGITFTLLAADIVANTYNFKIHTTDGVLTHDAPVTLVLAPDFHIVNTATSQSVAAGATATYAPFTFNPDGQGTFANAISYTCSGLPALSTCSFSPASIAAGSGSTPVTLSIHTTAAIASGTAPSLPWKPSGPLFAFWLSLPALGIVSLGSGRHSRKRLSILGGLLVVGLVGSFAACGGSSHHGSPGTPPGSYTITVNASAAAPGIAKQTTTVPLVVQ